MEQLTRLTKRQLEIAILIAKGLSNSEIAQELNITEGTVKNYVSAIYHLLCLDIAPENVRRVRVALSVIINGMLDLQSLETSDYSSDYASF